jgi:phage-related protein
VSSTDWTRDDWKPIPTVGPGVREIRIYAQGAHRVFYVAARAEAIYVLHAFEKKTQKTTARDLAIGRERYRAVAILRQQHGKEERR